MLKMRTAIMVAANQMRKRDRQGMTRLLAAT